MTQVEFPPEQEYTAIIRDQEGIVLNAARKKRGLALARLVVVVAGIAVVGVVWPKFPFAFVALALTGFVFAGLVFRDTALAGVIRDAGLRIRINRQELDALAYKMSAYESGARFSDPAHPYASDLDLFGTASLFQWINRGASDQSMARLAEEMKTGLTAALIPARQQAVREMAADTPWTQSFRVTALQEPLRTETEIRIRRWLDDPVDFPGHRWWPAIVWLHTITATGLFFLYLADIFPFGVFSTGFILLMAIAFFISARVMPAYASLSRIAPEMAGMQRQLRRIEEASFSSSAMRQLQLQLTPEDLPKASTSIGRLYEILNRFDFRLNIVIFVFLNTLLLWDLRQALALRAWKRLHAARIAGWMATIAETEVILSFAALAKNNPDWCFPTLAPAYFRYDAQGLGHPLIPPSQRITQDFSLNGAGRSAVITGANMAGKSTFLRSLGVNAVLAYTGAPACASGLELSRVELITSMRVADNLSENTSTFYAELKKLRYIIERVRTRAELFILLDEVLRGTNSEDRHAGTTALVRQLIREGTVSVIATHDTSLARTESERSDHRIENYHFDGQVNGTELFFDYRLKPGICESLNATALMKKIGIEIGD